MNKTIRISLLLMLGSVSNPLFAQIQGHGSTNGTGTVSSGLTQKSIFECSSGSGKRKSLIQVISAGEGKNGQERFIAKAFQPIGESVQGSREYHDVFRSVTSHRMGRTFGKQRIIQLVQFFSVTDSNFSITIFRETKNPHRIQAEVTFWDYERNQRAKIPATWFDCE